MILLTGASGTVGQRTARLLTHGGHAVRLLTRAPARLPDPGPNTEVAAGDFSDPESLKSALTGIRAALVITSDPLRPEHDANLLDAARRAGTVHLVKLSALAVTDPGAQDLITRWQRESEARIRESGLDWTLLRPRAFMSNTLRWAGSIREAGTVRGWPADAPSACIDPHDIAAVAAHVLTSPGHAGRSYALTGPEALTARQQTGILARVLGRSLVFRELSREQARAGLESRCPAPVVQALLDSAERQLRGAKGAVEPTVGRLLGRPARSYADWAREYLPHFTAEAAADPR